MSTLSDKDKNFIWHPYTQMKDATAAIVIRKAEGVYLFDENNESYIDACGSWWTNLHGHSHPYITKKIAEQASRLEHVIFGGFTHEPAIRLAERLLKILPANQQKVFYSDNGSTAVEVAIKMCLQYWQNNNQNRTKISAFKNSYHGDTFGAMSVSARNVFTKAFENLLFDVISVDVPFLFNETEALNGFEKIVTENKSELACFIFEPIVQGVAGMTIYSADALDKMIAICNKHNILTIADEVMTGFGRTGKFFASDYLRNSPDAFCLSKGLTGGALPLGVTTCTQSIYDAFLSSDKTKTFFHGHTYTANPLCCEAANASLDLFEANNSFEKIKSISNLHHEFVSNNQDKFPIHKFRTIGVILAIEISAGETHYLNSIADKAYSFFIERGILMRPLGNVIYIVPPYCITIEQLHLIYNTIVEFLNQLQNDV
jgi:adenosylmethionine-8-amino-7-oxononanoate aminotransferase